jgi:hypothetical protein
MTHYSAQEDLTIMTTTAIPDTRTPVRPEIAAALPSPGSPAVVSIGAKGSAKSAPSVTVASQTAASIKAAAVDNAYADFKYWRIPLPEINLPAKK